MNEEKTRSEVDSIKKNYEHRIELLNQSIEYLKADH